MTARRPTAPRGRSASGTPTARSGGSLTEHRPGAPTPRMPSTPATGLPGRTPAGRGTVGAATNRRRPTATRPSSTAKASARPASRSATARPSAGPGRPLSSRTARNRPPVIRPMTALAGVLVVLVLLIAPYVRPWVSQRSQISAAQQERAELERDVQTLTAERERWRDPAYVATQARERLKYVKPGEIAYSLLDDVSPVLAADPRLAAVAVPEQDAARSWYDTFWGSVVTAGDPTTRQPAS